LDLSYISISQVIASLNALIINIYFARSLGIDRFGEYAFLTGIAFFLATINGAGVQQALLSQRYDREKFFFDSARLLNLVTISILSLLALFIAYLCDHTKMFTVLAIFVAFSLRDFGKKELVVRDQYKKVLAVEISTSVFMCVAAAVFFEIKELKNPELVFIVALSLSCITLMPVIMPKLSSVSKRELGLILHFLKWVLPAALFSMAGIPALPIVLGLVLGTESVGIYRGIQNVFGMSNLVNQIYDTWLQPKSREINTQNMIDAIQVINLILFFVIGLLVYAYGELVFSFLYGFSFGPSSQFSVGLVLAAYALFGVSVPLTVERIRAKVFGRPKSLFKSSILHFSLCVFSYYAFLFSQSFSDVIWLLTLSSVITSVYLLLLVKNDRHK
jgi:O-antigen/teichoic acid export membrane protein